MELEKSLKDPERIGNELLIELEKEIDRIQEQMNNAIVSIYKIAKRITYDYDLFKKDSRRRTISEDCENEK